MKILLIGGTGFIGSHLLNRMSDTNTELRVFSPSAHAVNLKNVTGISGKIEDLDKLKPHAEWADTIIHLSSTTTPKTSIINPCYDASSNLIPLIGLLEIIKFKKTKIIFCSSGGGVYGLAEKLPIAEDAAKRPITPYGINKLAMEEYLLHYHLNYGVPYLIIRPSNIYGPNTKAVGKLGLINTLVYNCIYEAPTQIWADPSNIRDYIFIDDFMEGFIQLIKRNEQGIFNIGSGKGYSVTEIIRKVEMNLNKPLTITYPDVLLKDEPANILDIKKLNQLTAWKPITSLEEGIKKIAAHFRNN